MEINEVVLSMYQVPSISYHQLASALTDGVQTLTAMGVNAPMTSLMPFLNGIFAGVPGTRECMKMNFREVIDDRLQQSVLEHCTRLSTKNSSYSWG